MYISEVRIMNSGPLGRFEYELPINPVTMSPRPLVLVGPNGSGKSTLLSIIADSFFEAASNAFDDVVANRRGLSRPWFRLVGPWTLSAGAAVGYSIIAYRHDDMTFVYVERSGQLTDAEMEQFPEQFKPAFFGLKGDRDKGFNISDELARTVFGRSSLLYFPSSRSEDPHWLNTESVRASQFDLKQRLQNELRRRIFVEKGLGELEQWLMALLLDCRADFNLYQLADGQTVALAQGDLATKLQDMEVWRSVNRILQLILDDDSAGLVYGRRERALQLGYRASNGSELPLRALSAGQATLLNIFGTLMRYADQTSTGPSPGNIEAICLIDEIDAHMHIDLQSRALPELIAMFPRVQFIISSHSPLFALGLDRSSPAESEPVFLEMPTGLPIQAEAYSEFQHALDVLNKTKKFNELVAERVASLRDGRLLVLCEGETDPLYLRTAAEVLARTTILDRVEFDWIGKKDSRGIAENSGKDSLNAALKLFKTKPVLVDRPVLLLFDNDARKQDEDFGQLFIRTLPSNSNNVIVRGGIENLLPPEVFAEGMYSVKKEFKPNGTSVTVKALKKVELCELLCSERRPENFQLFDSALDMVEAVLVTAGDPGSEP